MATNPAPDLVVEVQIPRPLVRKLPIWAGFGVPELWVTDGLTVKILRLAEGTYHEHTQSGLLTPLGAKTLEEFLEKEHGTLGPRLAKAPA